MKRTLSFALALVMALSVVIAGTFSAGAADGTYLRFNDLITYVLAVGSGEVNVSGIAYWTSYHYDKIYKDESIVGLWENGKFTVSEDGDGSDFAYAADKFEDVAHHLFDFDGTLRELIEKENNPNCQLAYDAENGRYVYMLRGKGGVPYRINGYILQENGSYDVYIQRGRLVQNGDDFEEVWLDEYYKTNAVFDAPYTIVKSCESIDALPSEGLVPLPEYTYDCDDSVNVSRETFPFPDGTHISVKYASDAAVEEAKKALTDIAGPNMAVFDITAELNGAEIQPTDEVMMLIWLPETLSAEGLKLFRVGEDGKLTEIQFELISKELRIINVTLTHFSTYAFCNVGDVNGDGSLDTKDLVRLMKYIAVDGVGIEASAPDVNADGTVNTADLVRLMKMISEG